jgi:hypothetical protein
LYNYVALNEHQVKIRANLPAVTERWKIFRKTIQNKRAGFEVSVISTGIPKSIKITVENVFLKLSVMKNFLFLTKLSALSIMLGFTSCDLFHIGGGYVDRGMYVYIAGDANKTVQISYLEREKVKKTSKDKPDDGSPAPDFEYTNKNVVVTESVTLPFFKDVHFLGGIKSENDAFLEVVSENDSTTKAIIFDYTLLLEDSICSAFYVWQTESLYEHECSYCKDIPKDSVLAYLKRIDYPCYLEFSKGDTRKTVMMRDFWEW